MAENVGLDELVGSVAGSIVSAQAQVENHFIEQVSRYFDSSGRPRCLTLRLPKSSAAGETDSDYSQVGIPLLSLTESTMLAIQDMSIELDVELTSIVDQPTASPAAQSAPAEIASNNGFQTAGAPIDVPLEGAPQSEADTAIPAGPLAAATARAPGKRLALSIGKRPDSGPTAKLTINVAAQPRSEGLMRLLTQLNKYV